MIYWYCLDLISKYYLKAFSNAADSYCSNVSSIVSDFAWSIYIYGLAIFIINTAHILYMENTILILQGIQLILSLVKQIIYQCKQRKKDNNYNNLDEKTTSILKRLTPNSIADKKKSAD